MTLFLQFYFSLCVINHSLHCILLISLNTGHNTSHFNNFLGLTFPSYMSLLFQENSWKCYLSSFFPFSQFQFYLEAIPVKLPSSPMALFLSSHQKLPCCWITSPFSVLIFLYSIATFGTLNHFLILKVLIHFASRICHPLGFPLTSLAAFCHLGSFFLLFPTWD